MFDRDQKSKSSSLSDQPSHFSLGGCRKRVPVSVAENRNNSVIQKVFLTTFQRVSPPPLPHSLQHHGGAGLLPGGGAHLLFWSDGRLEGGPRGAGQPGVRQRLLPVCAGAAVVPGVRGLHGHGGVPPHSSHLLQLSALEEDKGASKKKRIKKEEVRTFRANGETWVKKE